jgi:hypothetical protein
VTVVSVARLRVDRRARATDGTVCVLLRNRPPTPWLECDAEYRPPTPWLACRRSEGHSEMPWRLPADNREPCERTWPVHINVNVNIRHRRPPPAVNDAVTIKPCRLVRKSLRHYTPLFVCHEDPNGCRNSDAALALYRDDVSYELGGIARTSGRNSWSLSIDVAQPRFSIVSAMQWSIDGEILEKVGRSTGWAAP